jgi:aryl-alcohol dehydrogenase-like predicted oxidoreductase
MIKIELCEGIFSSPLGFGCAPILGSVDATRARRALHCALDNGINHFDLARSYGYGEAERFVGDVLRGRRNEVVLASKFGIKANWKAKALTPVKPLIRWLKRGLSKPQSPNVAARNTLSIADRFHNRVNIDAKEMRNSLMQSLKALQTDHLDYFFIHEPVTSISNIDDLICEAEKLKEEGKIRAFGLAYATQHEDLHLKYLESLDVLQFNKPVTANSYKSAVENRGLKPNILFSVMNNKPIATQHVDMLKQLMKDFPKSVILCSMFNEEHIRQNVKSVIS